ncbi:MAG: dUTP pyrophosphatase [Defluviitaleaceae bacterium]|nr:dUTP pyrophosphatase [Defluviitaleaceae bacterium]
MNDKIYFSKVTAEAVIPSKRDEDGAFDIYACFEDDYLLLDPHETKLVPTGIASAFSSDYVAIIKERGSTGVKGMGQRAGVIDSGYRGQWFIPVTNHNAQTLVIAKKHVAKHFEQAIVYPYEKAIAQCLMVVVPKLDIEEIPDDELQKMASERGEGAFGSTGK